MEKYINILNIDFIDFLCFNMLGNECTACALERFTTEGA